MKIHTLSMFGALSLVAGVTTATLGERIQTIEEYNSQLPTWGTSWLSGKQATNGYYPSFYTGFAMRVQTPERIHIRVSRGNQTRVSTILDENTITDYSFDLVKRYDFYRNVTKDAGAKLNTNPPGSKLTPQLEYYNQIIESPEYGILSFVESANKGVQSPEAIYTKNLNLIKALNPGRVFMINLNLGREFTKWKSSVVGDLGNNVDKIISNPQSVIIALNTLVFGRINFDTTPSEAVLAKLKAALNSAVANEADETFIAKALDLFKEATGNKYNLKVVNSQGKWQEALQCQSPAYCFLSYPEFTAIYPTGSVMAKTKDEFGNQINTFATPGLWSFIARSNGRGVDNIRSEPYYGYIPKMDYQDIGNGFHNPAVRFRSPSKSVKSALNLDPSHDNFWSVKRGGVSHGCLRLPTGQIWELRHIMPVEDERMTKVSFFGNRPQDFDLYDIDGTGELKVMGVEYFISYSLQGASGESKREGGDLFLNEDKRQEFYKDLYGAKNVFTLQDGKYSFINPKVSMPSHLDYQKAKVLTYLQVKGTYPLYEQKYEQDKVQYYAIDNLDSNKKMIRLMGRIRGCASTSDKAACGEKAFDTEAKGLVK